ncbi:MAG: acetyl-CoA carboxylase biotin carboxyl carrier protein [Acetobacteraceae bacterium]
MTSLPFSAESIRELAAILTETGLTEIELAEGERRIRVARSPAPAAFAVPSAAAVAAEGEPAVPAIADAEHPGAVVSPLVGVAYLSPEPGAAPFVSLGAAVSEGQTVLLIEAMKTFNQIKAPRSGTVSRILVASGSPVEYGEALMIIE